MDKKEAFGRGRKVFLALSTFCMAVFTFMGASGIVMPISYTLSALFGVIAVSIVAVFFRRNNNAPQIEPDLFGEDEIYTITYDSKEDCRLLNQSTHRIFGRDHVDDKIVESWRKKNPKGFLCLKDNKGNLCAGLSFVSFTPEFLKFFLNGSLSEDDIDDDCLNDFETSLMQDHLYLTFIVSVNSGAEFRKKHSSIMLWGAIKYLEKYFCDRDKAVKIYVLPINVNSINSIERFRVFNICSPAACRKDKHNLYAMDLTRDNIKILSSRIGADYSQACRLEL
jgi:hypothetical protein